MALELGFMSESKARTYPTPNAGVVSAMQTRTGVMSGIRNLYMEAC